MRRGCVHADVAVRAPRPIARQIFGQLRRLARAGLARDDDDLVRVDRVGDVVHPRRDRQLLGKPHRARGSGAGERSGRRGRPARGNGSCGTRVLTVREGVAPPAAARRSKPSLAARRALSRDPCGRQKGRIGVPWAHVSVRALVWPGRRVARRYAASPGALRRRTVLFQYGGRGRPPVGRACWNVGRLAERGEEAGDVPWLGHHGDELQSPQAAIHHLRGKRR